MLGPILLFLWNVIPLEAVTGMRGHSDNSPRRRTRTPLEYPIQTGHTLPLLPSRLLLHVYHRHHEHEHPPRSARLELFMLLDVVWVVLMEAGKFRGEPVARLGGGGARVGQPGPSSTDH